MSNMSLVVTILCVGLALFSMATNGNPEPFVAATLIILAMSCQ